MPPRESWFRPWLDDPGPWEGWQLDAEEAASFAALQAAAGEVAEGRLVDCYGAQADRFGAVALARRLSLETVSAEDLFRTALILLALDCYRARAPVPRPAAGGSTNPANRERWAVLRPHLIARLEQWLGANASGSLFARAVLGRVAEDWIPAAQIGRRLEETIMASGDFTSVEVAFDLRPPARGGEAWLKAEAEKTLAAIRDLLAERQPALIEVLRDPGTAPAGAQLLVVYRLEEEPGQGAKLLCYDPADAPNARFLKLGLGAGGLRFEESPASEDRAVVKGIRLVDLPSQPPPLSRFRRWFRWIFSICWYVRRRWLIFRRRKRDEILGAVSPDIP